MRTIHSLVIAAALSWLGAVAAQAGPRHFWRIPSPDHEQTFTYGSERGRQWTQSGADRHLAVWLHFTNDPYVNVDYPRRYDDFLFSFPPVKLGPDGIFYYRDDNDRRIPIAQRRTGLFGIEEVDLFAQCQPAGGSAGRASESGLIRLRYALDHVSLGETT